VNIQQLVQAMTPQIYENLRTAVEIGKWPDGNPLTEEQKSNSLQAVLMYQARVEQSEQHMTIGRNGEVVQKSRSQLKKEFDKALGKKASHDTTKETAEQSSTHDIHTIARFKQDDI
jgi:uncharacterized protein YeaC (DUF1315 family)